MAVVVCKMYLLANFALNTPTISDCIAISLRLTTGRAQRFLSANQHDTYMYTVVRLSDARICELCFWWWRSYTSQCDKRNWLKLIAPLFQKRTRTICVWWYICEFRVRDKTLVSCDALVHSTRCLYNLLAKSFKTNDWHTLHSSNVMRATVVSFRVENATPSCHGMLHRKN